MPFVRISLADDTPAPALRAIGEAVHGALVAVAGVPADERFQVIERRRADELVFDRRFGGARDGRARVVFVEITLVRELSEDRKRQLFRDIAARLEREAGVRGDDLFVVLRENTLADWSQAHGEATLLDPSPSP
jgi:phenylpyruvate tautomerase PptA (4-oxalocrotonate tautomerase family)